MMSEAGHGSVAVGRERTQSRRRGRRQGNRRSIYIAGAAVALGAVAAVILLAVLSSGGGSSDTQILTPVVPSPRPAAVARNGLVYGDPNAPVTITEYLDFQ